jgi:hypothetical protein
MPRGLPSGLSRRPEKRLASALPPMANTCRPITVRVKYTAPTAVTAIIVSIGTGYNDAPRPSGAFATLVRIDGNRMLSAWLETKATPRNIHIVPSVMMNG